MEFELRHGCFENEIVQGEICLHVAIGRERGPVDVEIEGYGCAGCEAIGQAVRPTSPASQAVAVFAPPEIHEVAPRTRPEAAHRRGKRMISALGSSVRPHPQDAAARRRSLLFPFCRCDARMPINFGSNSTNCSTVTMSMGEVPPVRRSSASSNAASWPDIAKATSGGSAFKGARPLCHLPFHAKHDASFVRRLGKIRWKNYEKLQLLAGFSLRDAEQ